MPFITADITGQRKFLRCHTDHFKSLCVGEIKKYISELSPKLGRELMTSGLQASGCATRTSSAII